jgi:hypothetical protein
MMATTRIFRETGGTTPTLGEVNKETNPEQHDIGQDEARNMQQQVIPQPTELCGAPLERMIQEKVTANEDKNTVHRDVGRERLSDMQLRGICPPTETVEQRTCTDSALSPAVEAVLTEDELKQPEENENIAATSCCKRSEPPTAQEVEATEDSTVNTKEPANILIEHNENEGMEWKVSEVMPVHMCGKSANSSEYEECEFALCADCYVPPNARGNRGRKRVRSGAESVTCDCNHQDMNTLRRFEAPGFFQEKFRNNKSKHFLPTKCANCKVGFRARLSSVGLAVKRT